MIGSFGLVANPAEYRNSGVMTFIVNHEGVVFQKDLGPRTAELAERMTAFNPDSSWTKVSDTELGAEPGGQAELPTKVSSFVNRSLTMSPRPSARNRSRTRPRAPTMRRTIPEAVSSV